MSAHREKIFERRGEGTLKPKNNDTIDVEFACYQYSDGNIEGTIKLLEKKHLRSDYIDHKECNLSAELENGERLCIKNLRTRFASRQLVDNSQSQMDVKFDAFGLSLEGREFLSNRTKKYCKFGIPGIYSIGKSFGIDIGNFTFAIDDKEISEYSPCTTSYIKIDLNDGTESKSVEECKSLLYEKIGRILLLTSFARGSRIDWAYFELFEQNDEKKSYEQIYSERKVVPYNDSGWGWHVISREELYAYLETAYSTYADDFDENTGFDFAIHWYLESFRISSIESMYIKLFTALEVLVIRFVGFEGRKNIFTGEGDFEEFRNQLEDRIEGVLEDMDETKRESICDKLWECFKECKNIFETEGGFKEFRKQLEKQIKNKKLLEKEGAAKRAAIYKKLGELNRYPFKTNLELFLTKYDIGFKDLIDDLEPLIKYRNEIIHRGSTKSITPEKLIGEYDKLLTLIQRIFLSLLEYNGEYYNGIKEKYEQFNKNPNNDVHCSD
jgi:hypothetical protein